MLVSFDDGLVASSRAAPGLDPSLVYAINQGSSDAADAVDNSQATHAFGSSLMFSNTFNDQDPWVQQKILDHISPPQAAMIKSAGAKPKSSGGGGIFGSVLGALGTATSAVEHAAGTAVSGAAYGLGAGLRGTEHLIRAAHLLSYQGETGSRDDFGSLARMFSPSDWANAWNLSENGERTFDPGQYRQISNQYGQQNTDLAARIVGGTAPEDVAKSLPEEQRAEFIDQLRTPQFQELMKNLQASKISFGRDLVGRQLLVHSPTVPGFIPVLGNKTVGSDLSGAIDATTDMFIDPTLAAAKAAGAARVARYLVSSEDGAATVDRLLTSDRATQRLVNDVTDHLQSVAAGDQSAIPRLMQRYPQFANVIPEWTQRGITTQEDLGNWFRAQAEQGTLFTGRGGGAVPKAFAGMGYQGTMPNLSLTEQAMVSAKQKITQAIDWAVERPSAVETQRLVQGAGIEDPLTISQRLQRGVIEPIGNAARSMTTLVPEAGPTDINDPKMLTYIQRYAKMGDLPTADQNRLVTAFSQAADEAGKRNVFKSTILSAMRGMGVDENYMQQWADNLDQGIIGRAYSPGGIDKIQLGNDTVSAAVLENQLSHIVELPSYRDMLAQSNRVGFAKAAWGVSNSNMVSSFMDNVWKPITLLRLGFPIRAGGEEAVNQMLRMGPLDFLRARFAGSAAEELGGPVKSSALGFLVDHLPEDAQLRVTTAADLAGERWANTAGQALANVKGAVAGDQMLSAAKEVANLFPQALPDEISAAHGIPGYLGTPETATEMTRNGEKMKMVFQPTGGFREYSPTDPGQVTAWKYSLDQLAKDRLGQQALKLAADESLSREDQVSQLADYLQSPTFKDSWDRATRSKVLRDGSQVGVDATAQDAANDWARTVLSHVDALTTDGEGNQLVDPQGLLDAGRGPTIRDLQKLDTRPPTVGGPEVLPVPQNAWRSFLDKGFDRIVGRPMNWIARQPIFLQNYANARADLEPLRAQFERLAFADAPDAVALPEATKVVDSAGNPLKVFHGTNAAFDQFELQPSRYEGAGQALYFTDSPEYAKTHSVMQSGGTPNVREAYLDIRNPARLDDARFLSQEQIDALKAQGHDGVISREGGATSYIAFDPQQVIQSPLAAQVGKVQAQVDTHLQELASQRALADTIPYIHNPEVRSQFAVYTKNLMPFWFAQEQFIKRWASTFVHSPEAFREAQLAMNGLRHSGVVHKDDQGNEVFTYPGVDLTADALSALTSIVTGNKVMIPQPLTFNGEVKFATPGTERLGVPSFGPLVSLPLTAMADRFPELQKAQEQVLGQRGVGRGYLEQIVPTTVSRLAQTFMANPDADAQMASAQKQALQYFAAHGRIPDEAASPQEKQNFLEDLKWTARTIALLRTMYGFATPAAPETQIDPDHITTEFRQLLGSGIPIGDAVNELVKMHPHETVTPYTVFQSKSVSGAPIPATADALTEFEDNRDFYARYPNAAAWLLPQKSADPKFDLTAYRESLALGLRQKKAPEQMLNDIYYAMDAQNFFDSLKAKNDLLKANAGPLSVQNRQSINQSWSNFQQRYFDMHPVFADKYQSNTGHIDRMQAIDELHAALVDPNSPDVPQAGPLTTLLANWDDLKDRTSALAGRRNAFTTNQRTDLINSFQTWAGNFLDQHPELQGVYDRLFRPELP